MWVGFSAGVLVPICTSVASRMPCLPSVACSPLQPCALGSQETHSWVAVSPVLQSLGSRHDVAERTAVHQWWHV